MPVRLAPCPSCDRHLMVTEPSCPFCGLGLVRGAPSPDPLRPAPARRLGRAAIFAFRTSIGIATVAGCGSTTALDDLDAAVEADATLADAGRADAGRADGGQPEIDGGGLVEPDAGDDAGGLIAAYGGPIPVDAGPDSGSVAPLYGLPAFDGGTTEMDEDAGSVGDLYGAPPSEGSAP